MKNRYIGAIVAIAILITLGAFTYTSSETKSNPEEGFKNLKVLPQNITNKQLDSVMGEFSISLGVRCGFCHARKADTTQRGLDFASDKKRRKEYCPQYV